MHDRAGRWAIVVCALGCATGPLPRLAADEVRVASPSGAVQFRLAPDEGQLTYTVTLNGKPAVDSSPLEISIDGLSITTGAEIGAAECYRVNETYSCRGNHCTAVNHCNGVIARLRRSGGPDWTLDVRAYDDGVAFRYSVPGTTVPRVPDEATRFVLPSGSTVWFHDLHGHYEGVHRERDVTAVQAGEWAAPPMTVRLPGGTGYAAISEAALVNYSGMALRADGRRGFELVLGHNHPVSHPFKLRYSADDIEAAWPGQRPSLAQSFPRGEWYSSVRI